MASQLPPGQYSMNDFPRFGLDPYANRFPADIDNIVINLKVEEEPSIINDIDLQQLDRIEQTSDFHCVTTWSKQDLLWGGYRFADFYEKFVKSKYPKVELKYVVLRAQDGYRTTLLLEDLLADDVMLADRLNAKPLSVEHGAPIRIVAPGHYGYKNLKHLNTIEFSAEKKEIKPSSFSFMDHPRGRVAFEERAKGAPGWVFRYLYRPLVKSTVKKFSKAMEAYSQENK